jgi:hypothetical protein
LREKSAHQVNSSANQRSRAFARLGGRGRPPLLAWYRSTDRLVRVLSCLTFSHTEPRATMPATRPVR